MKCFIFKIDNFFSKLLQKDWLLAYLSNNPKSFQFKIFFGLRDFFFLKACQLEELEKEKEAKLRVSEFLLTHGKSWKEKVSSTYEGCNGWDKIVVISNTYYSIKLTSREIRDVRPSTDGQIEYAKKQEKERQREEADRRRFISQKKSDPSQKCWEIWTRGIYHGQSLIHRNEVWATSEEEACKEVRGRVISIEQINY